ncbi:hypothetical protein H6G81_23990 [Scytonema hofmannii FACHB-248]|uniref:Uncharacterized protein n=1 Tax=Scytonema hofmannii FACHB-248 TaxID=1842502 RepID=A0ABR8GVF6_9CYAN|nr:MULTISPECIES: hypothetical protein [Nostocales]MBD2607502.1 hypothetical protein [Scytonema hofmannii FACHB-248]
MTRQIIDISLQSVKSAWHLYEIVTCATAHEDMSKFLTMCCLRLKARNLSQEQGLGSDDGRAS